MKGEQLFQRARRLVIAEMQNILYGEYLPIILGNIIFVFGLFSSSVADRIQVQGKRIPVLQHLARERERCHRRMNDQVGA